MRAVSPLVLMQRRAGLYPGAGLDPGALVRIAQGGGVQPRSRQRMGAFGASNTVQEGVTGIKSGVTAASVSTAVGAGVASAIGAGAAAGSVVPIIGTAIGAIVGLLASGVLDHRKDPEVANFDQASALYRTGGANAAINIANKYLVLAGLFDLLPGQIKGNIPIYKKYGRMGEERFVRDLAATIQSAANTGRIVATDTPMSVFANVVQPWIDSFGYGAMQDSNAGMINAVLLGMTAEYLAGQQNRWYAVGGDFPFGNLPKFSLPVAVTQAAPPAPVPTNAPGTSTPAVQPYLPPRPDLTGGSGRNPAVPVTPSVQVPPGFVLIAGASGSAPVYQDPQGAYWALNGSTLSPYTGTINTNGQLVPIQNGLMAQSAVANTPQVSFPSPANPLLQPQSMPFGPTIVQVPTSSSVQPVSAGLSGNNSLLIVGGLAVLAVLFATVRPAPMTTPTRARGAR